MRGAHLVANEFLRLSRDEGRALTPLQLMKLVYIAHGWMLALYQRPLFHNRIEAWKFGPVVPDLYQAIKHYGSDSINGPIEAYPFPAMDGEREELESVERDLVRQVYQIYGHMNGVRLSALTHKPGTPWAETYDSNEWNAPISNDMIAEHYRRLARERATRRSRR